MCQRKIIGEGTFRIVPLMKGCDCPKIVEVRDADLTPELKLTPIERAAFRATKMNYCYDMHTSMVAAPGMHIIFRHCVCHHFSGMCMKLPPLLVPDFFADQKEDDDENDEPNWGVRV